jgi:hypothetical protein
MKKFNANDFLEDLIEDVVSSGKAGKKFEADPDKLGPLLITLQRELASRPAPDETVSQPPAEDSPSQSSS